MRKPKYFSQEEKLKEYISQFILASDTSTLLEDYRAYIINDTQLPSSLPGAFINRIVDDINGRQRNAYPAKIKRTAIKTWIQFVVARFELPDAKTAISAVNKSFASTHSRDGLTVKLVEMIESIPLNDLIKLQENHQRKLQSVGIPRRSLAEVKLECSALEQKIKEIDAEIEKEMNTHIHE